MHKGTDKTKCDTFTVKGVTYTAQFNGARASLIALDKYKNNLIGLEDYVLQNVIVDPPGLTLDDFDTVDEAQAVVNHGIRVMKGIFRTRNVDGGSETASGEAGEG